MISLKFLLEIVATTSVHVSHRWSHVPGHVLACAQFSHLNKSDSVGHVQSGLQERWKHSYLQTAHCGNGIVHLL